MALGPPRKPLPLPPQAACPSPSTTASLLVAVILPCQHIPWHPEIEANGSVTQGSVNSAHTAG